MKKIVEYTTHFSIYEVEWDDERAGGRVRRLLGINAPTDRMAADGEWRRAEGILDLPNDAGLWISWNGDSRGTWTSAIVSRRDLSSS